MLSKIKGYLIFLCLIVVASGAVYAKINNDQKTIEKLESDLKVVNLEKGRLEDTIEQMHTLHESLLRENKLAQELVQASKEEVFLHLTELEALRENLFKKTEKLPVPIKKEQDIVETEQKKKLVRARSALLWEAYCETAKDTISCKDKL